LLRLVDGYGFLGHDQIVVEVFGVNRVVVNRIAVGIAGRMRTTIAPAVGLGQAGVDGHKGTSTTDAGWRAGD
jgi:hypothetical protein